ncbi:MAG: AMP-binding protein [Rhodospirillaceae bacterium]|nr:AMP-binding protein [Rhodospirillaceae bacterium]MBT4588109.1 AMP-binding protein [Rhodospirillaceae bacterium]MBT7268426.1 AMP-binding protein [Rhodospirillaceae bacterium]
MHLSYFHRGGDDPLLGTTIPERFAQIVKKYPDNDAVVSCRQERRLSYRDFSLAVDQAAKALFAFGFGRGDRIGVWSTDNIEWLVLQMATARIGAILVNINPAYRPRELEYALQTSEVQGLFTIPAFSHSNYPEMLIELIPEIKQHGGVIQSEAFPHLSRIVLFDPADPMNTDVPEKGFLPWQDFLDFGHEVDPAVLEDATHSLECDDPINIQYTSGTTGFPKAVVLTHHNILNNAYFTAQAMKFGPTDRLCVPVPFYHCFGMVLSNLLCLSVGACIVVPAEHFDPLAVLQAIEQEHCTALHGVPTMFIGELEHARFDEFDLTSLRTGIMAGAPCPPELMKRVINDMHCREILIGYGQTEASPITHLTHAEDSLARRTETVGTNLPHQEVKIVDPETNKTLPLGEIGDVCFRGYHVMSGYYNNPEATAKTVDAAGWLHSGDLGSMDQEGYVKITGRLKEMIIRGGENIYPAEIEAYLFSHEKIAQVAVFGVADEKLGEEIVVWVQLHQGVTMDEDELLSFCRDGLAHFKVPHIVKFVEEFPMTVTGKIQKFRMREMMAGT